jgi:multicomponent Na+:H+ antiporter subunit D
MNELLPHLPALAVVVSLATAPLVFLLRERVLAWAAATAASLCSFAIAAGLARHVREEGPLSYAMGGWQAPYGIELVVDALSALLLLIVTGASTVALLVARQALSNEVPPERQHLLFTAWLLALAGLSGIIVSGDAFNIFVFLEISSLATYIMIAGGPQRQALSAVFKYLIIGTIGATFYLIGVGLIYMMTGTLNLADMADRLGEVSDLRPVLAAAGFITIGLALKAAVFPLHTWLPNAYTFAPHAVTVFIAACATKVSLYVLLRFDFLVFQGNLPGHILQFAGFVVPLGILAVLVASVVATLENDLKRLLAYSSVAQVGYILVGAGLASSTGLTAAILHMFNHALAKGALFVAVACLAMRVGTLTLDDGLAGAGRRQPLTMAAFIIAGLSLIGLPGTAGFVSKWYLVSAALELGFWGVLLLLPVLAGSVLAVVYLWRVIEAAYFRPGAADAIGGEAPPGMLAVLWAAALANLYFGLQPGVPLELAERAAAALLY